MNEILFKNADEKIKKLVKIIQESIKGTAFENHVFLVGGCVRDLLLKIPCKDVDICVDIKNGGMLFGSRIHRRRYRSTRWSHIGRKIYARRKPPPPV